jgi:hypothetical protein
MQIDKAECDAIHKIVVKEMDGRIAQTHSQAEPAPA